MIVAFTLVQWAAVLIAVLVVANLAFVLIWVAIHDVAHRIHSERQAKGQTIELQPTPGRSRLGETRRPPRGRYRRRP